MDISYRRANLQDVEHIGRHMRKADRLEIGAQFSDVTASVVLAESFGLSGSRCWVAQPVSWYGPPICMVGVADLGGCIGAPWLLGTDDCQRHRKDILKLGRWAVSEFLKQFMILRNTIDTNNHMHVRWVKAMGFTVHEDGQRFQLFERKADYV